jgi:hypothetical protein
VINRVCIYAQTLRDAQGNGRVVFNKENAHQTRTVSVDNVCCVTQRRGVSVPLAKIPEVLQYSNNYWNTEMRVEQRHVKDRLFTLWAEIG